jgi:hypothetical protein
MSTEEASIGNIDELVNRGKVIITADSSIIHSMVQSAIESGLTSTFYISRKQCLDILRSYWTLDLIAETGLKSVPKEEIAKIEKQLDVKVVGQCFSNYLECPNGHTYGAYEFIKQGISEHGPEFVKGVIDAQETSVIRVNPSGWEVCPTCQAMVLGPHYYTLGNGRYGCCRKRTITA